MTLLYRVLRIDCTGTQKRNQGHMAKQGALNALSICFPKCLSMGQHGKSAELAGISKTIIIRLNGA
jgi:hypothetical protein